MIDFFITNFNWPTFLLAMIIFFLVANVFNLIVRMIAVRRARKRLQAADAKHAELKAQFAAKEKELNELIGKKEAK